MNETEWDERYASADQTWSGEPNGALVAEVAGLAPARVLDVGCGEGADAVWLARRGWDVTALDVSAVALGRAQAAAVAADVAITWVHSGLAEAGLAPGSFELVSAQYPALLRTPEHLAETALLAAVAPGGLLLVVHHDVSGHQPGETGGFNPDDYVHPRNLIGLLGDEWEIQIDELRERAISGGAGAHHSVDQVLRARRLR